MAKLVRLSSAVLLALVVGSFALALRQELRRSRTGLVSAEVVDFSGDRSLRLQVRPPGPDARIAVTCRDHRADPSAKEGSWIPPAQLRGNYPDGVALGVYGLGPDTTDCEVVVGRGDGAGERRAWCIDPAGAVDDDACLPPITTPGAALAPIE